MPKTKRKPQMPVRSNRLVGRAVARKVATAYWDEGGWVLYDANGDLIEEWPPNWPKATNSLWLEEHGIKLV